MIKIDGMHSTNLIFEIFNYIDDKFSYFINIKINFYFNIFIDVP